MILRVTFLVCTAACASPGFPPGGPDDSAPPKLLSVLPESGSVSVSPRSVVLRFDEVVNERPQAAADLSGLVLISPRDGAPRVDWRRTALGIRPRRRWKPNTVYTVTLLPGLSDLRGNAQKEGTTIIFSTGTTLPHSRLHGAVFDWVGGKPAGRAAVEAFIPADTSTVYVTQADSTGRFVFTALQPGTYIVRGYIDANSNRALDPREQWDSARVTLSDTAGAALYAFVHDTIGPRISAVEVRDSLTLRVTFDKPIDTGQNIDTTLFRLVAADSTVIPVLVAREARAWEKARADSAARSDSAARQRTDPVPFPARRARGDSVRAEPPPTLDRPVPATDVVLQVYPPLGAGRSYRLQARAIRGLLRNARTSERVFSLPARARTVPAGPTTDSSAKQPPQ